MAERKVIVTIAPTGGMASKKQNRTASSNMFQANNLHTNYNSKTTYKRSQDTSANWNKSQPINGAGIITEESQAFINQMNF